MKAKTIEVFIDGGSKGNPRFSSIGIVFFKMEKNLPVSS